MFLFRNSLLFGAKRLVPYASTSPSAGWSRLKLLTPALAGCCVFSYIVSDENIFAYAESSSPSSRLSDLKLGMDRAERLQWLKNVELLTEEQIAAIAREQHMCLPCNRTMLASTCALPFIKCYLCLQQCSSSLSSSSSSSSSQEQGILDQSECKKLCEPLKECVVKYPHCIIPDPDEEEEAEDFQQQQWYEYEEEDEDDDDDDDEDDDDDDE